MAFANEEERYDALSGTDRDISLSARDQYFREVAWMEPLADEEREKFLQRVLRGNRERTHSAPNQWVLSLAQHARDRLVEAYQPLVIALARRRVFLFQSMQVLDVIQEGNLGLLEALDRYDEHTASAFEFGAFATTLIKSAIAQAFRKTDTTIRVTSHVYDLVSQKRNVEAELRKQLGRDPLLSEIAEAMQVTEVVLTNALMLLKRREMGSLQGMLEHQEISEDTVPFVSLYASAVAAEDTRQRELAETVERVFEGVLLENQRHVLQLRYGFGDGSSTLRSHEVVSEMMGCEKTLVVNYERRAKDRLREVLKPERGADGRVSWRFDEKPTNEYCTSRQVRELLGVSESRVDDFVRQGLLSCEVGFAPGTTTKRVRLFKTEEVQELQEVRAWVAHQKKRLRLCEIKSLLQARRSAALPAIVA